MIRITVCYGLYWGPLCKPPTKEEKCKADRAEHVKRERMINRPLCGDQLARNLCKFSLPVSTAMSENCLSMIRNELKRNNHAKPAQQSLQVGYDFLWC